MSIDLGACPWVIVHGVTLACSRCAVERAIYSTPRQVGEHVGVIRAFVEEHARCAEPAIEPKRARIVREGRKLTVHIEGGTRDDHYRDLHQTITAISRAAHHEFTLSGPFGEQYRQRSHFDLFIRDEPAALAVAAARVGLEARGYEVTVEHNLVRAAALAKLSDEEKRALGIVDSREGA